ncbi:MAG: hypothetical protein WBF32_10940, partial [Candidatus Aminicenantaceae bacterium]
HHILDEYVKCKSTYQTLIVNRANRTIITRSKRYLTHLISWIEPIREKECIHRIGKFGLYGLIGRSAQNF